MTSLGRGFEPFEGRVYFGGDEVVGVLGVFVHEGEGVGRLDGVSEVVGRFEVVDGEGGVGGGDADAVEVAVGELDEGGFVWGVVAG